MIPKTSVSFLFYFIRKYKYHFLLLQFFYLGLALNTSIWPYNIKLLIDKLTVYDHEVNIWQYLMPVLMFIVSCWILIEVMSRLSGWLFAYTMPKFEAGIRMEMFEYVKNHSYSYFAENFSGTILNKVGDMIHSTRFIIQTVMTNIIPMIFTLVFILSVFLYKQPLFGVIYLVWIVLHLLIAYFGGKKCKEYAKIHAESRSALMGRIVDVFTNIINVKLFVNEKHESSKLRDVQKDEYNKNIKSFITIEKLKIVLGVLTFIFPCVLVTSLLIFSFNRKLITLGDFVFIFNISWMLMAMVWQLGIMLPTFFQSFGVCAQAIQVLSTPYEIVDSPTAKDIQFSRGTIQFKNVSFYYSKNNLLFNDLNLTIPAGQKIGLIGFSGSGKSSLVNLLMRFYDIQSGEILIDSHNIQDLTVDSLRQQITVIAQEPILFHRTIMENIKYGNLEATEDEIIAAARHAECHDFIMKLKYQYDTIVGERGIKLSGGQRQRVTIARAILKQSPILILDEATSALDSSTESHLQNALNYLMRDKTTLIISHRLSTLANVNQIIVLNNGKIIEYDKIENLIGKKGYFYNMWKKQNNGFLPDLQFSNSVNQVN